MDAPNAPNPPQPNAQDQFVDAVQGPANQVQGPAAQNQNQGPAVQNQVQDPVAQNQAQGQVVHGPAQVGQNVPLQPQQQQAPSTRSPCRSNSACSSGILSKLDRKEA